MFFRLKMPEKDFPDLFQVMKDNYLTNSFHRRYYHLLHDCHRYRHCRNCHHYHHCLNYRLSFLKQFRKSLLPESFHPNIHQVQQHKMNLLQLRNSENLKFKNKDVQTIFDVSRLIYGKNYGKITSIYKDQNLTNELGIVIGAITGSQELINYAASEKEGGQFNMCTALDELIESGKEKLLTEMVEKKLAKNKTPDTIADELETDISIINNIIEKIEKSA